MFKDRREAGQRLAHELRALSLHSPLVLALPRGGLPVAEPIARAVDAPLDVLIVRKLGAPWNREFAWGAVGEAGVIVRNPALLDSVSLREQDEIVRSEEEEIARRVHAYRADRSLPPLKGHAVVIVDDGLATGATATAGVQVAHALGAEQVVLAVPVGSREAVRDLSNIADTVICLEQPVPFSSVGEHYYEFPQVSDQEVVEILRVFNSDRDR